MNKQENIEKQKKLNNPYIEDSFIKQRKKVNIIIIIIVDVATQRLQNCCLLISICIVRLL